MRAFVLVNTEMGSEEKVLEQLKNLSSVKEAHRVHGVYDAVAIVEVEKAMDLKDVVSSRIRRIEGIRFTLTIPTVKGFTRRE